jgi:modification methylase
MSDAYYNRIYHHSCENMSELPGDCIDLTVTSPPYWNAINYDVHCASEGANYRPRERMDYEQYLEFLDGCFNEVLRVTRPGSVCAVVIGTVLSDRVHTPLPFHFTAHMERLGWLFFQDIIWSKCTGGVKRFSSSARNPFPGYYYPNIMTEYILLFKKPGDRKAYHGKSTEEKEAHRIELDSVTTKDVANNIWHIAPVPPRQLDHPCPFPEEIPYRLLRWFTYSKDTVLDPFCGVGATLKVANNLDRHWVGYEILEKYVDAAEERVKEPLQLRKQLVVNYDKLEYGEKQERTSPVRRPFYDKSKDK